MELGESAAEGAARETMEEAQADVEVISHFAHLDIPVIGQVGTRVCSMFPHWISPAHEVLILQGVSYIPLFGQET
jgi:hypothetical protein